MLSRYMHPLNFSALRLHIWLILVNLKPIQLFTPGEFGKNSAGVNPKSTPQFDFSLKKIKKNAN